MCGLLLTSGSGVGWLEGRVGVGSALPAHLLEVIAETTDLSSDDEADHKHTNIYQ